MATVGSPVFSYHQKKAIATWASQHPSQPTGSGYGSGRPRSRRGFSVKLTLQWSEMAAVERDASFSAKWIVLERKFGAFFFHLDDLGWWPSKKAIGTNNDVRITDILKKNALFFLVWRMGICGEIHQKREKIGDLLVHINTDRSLGAKMIERWIEDSSEAGSPFQKAQIPFSGPCCYYQPRNSNQLVAIQKDGNTQNM